ncbi:hypothetical protein RQM47_09960 [Rubrivirga sp. S365]|uniref:hypothetical protein n=1 Tax=Rubrivirga sp. S365 TaxID=3076080 RepID=UPI0028C9CD98|nr:hypothetical protein [Rubrivirga sp. S365]MDT7856964.1 hypothetical protein [Rubrivirga sp. S365]
MNRAGWIAAGVLVAIVVGLVALWGVADRGPFAALAAERVAVHNAEAGRLDTLRLRGRVVTASVGGTVVQIDPDDRVWLDLGDGAFPLRVPGGDSLAVRDRLLAVGRVRGRGGLRWLDVEAWTRVTASVR